MRYVAGLLTILVFVVVIGLLGLRLAAMLREIAILPGKHANDQMFSFYCISPSGFQVEIGWGARPATHQSEYYTGDSYGHQFTPAGMPS